MTKFDTSQISQITNIPEQHWALINRRAGMMTATPYQWGGLYYKQFQDIPTLSNLINVCVSWENTSWPLVVNIVTQSKSLSERLLTFLQNVQGSGGDVSTLQQLASDAVSLKELAQPFETQLGQFASANITADNSPQRQRYSSSFIFFDLSPNLNAVTSAAAAIIKGWGNIIDDMDQAIASMQGAKQGFGSFMSQIELETAVTDWREIVTKFQQSIGNMNNAAGELTGEAAYQVSPVQEGTYYHVRLDHPYEPSAMAVNSRGLIVMQPYNSSAANQQWRFYKRSHGYYAITSADGSFANQALYAGPRIDHLLMMAELSDVYAYNMQAFRIIEANQAGLRIINLAVTLQTNQQLVLQNDAPHFGEAGTLTWKPLIEGQAQPIQTWKFTEV